MILSINYKYAIPYLFKINFNSQILRKQVKRNIFIKSRKFSAYIFIKYFEITFKTQLIFTFYFLNFKINLVKTSKKFPISSISFRILE
jgi:hypothetical protein